jgi:hypothetical protein
MFGQKILFNVKSKTKKILLFDGKVFFESYVGSFNYATLDKFGLISLNSVRSSWINSVRLY